MTKESIIDMTDTSPGSVERLINNDLAGPWAMIVMIRALAAERDALRHAAALAYGRLWWQQGDQPAVHHARRFLRDMLDKDQKKHGITEAIGALGPVPFDGSYE